MNQKSSNDSDMKNSSFSSGRNRRISRSPSRLSSKISKIDTWNDDSYDKPSSLSSSRKRREVTFDRSFLDDPRIKTHSELFKATLNNEESERKKLNYSFSTGNDKIEKVSSKLEKCHKSSDDDEMSLKSEREMKIDQQEKKEKKIHEMKCKHREIIFSDY